MPVADDLLSNLVNENMSACPAACVELLSYLIEANYARNSVLKVAEKVVSGLINIGKVSATSEFHELLQKKSTKPMNAAAIVQLWNALIHLQAFKLIDAAVLEMMAKPAIFDPVLELIPALCSLHRQVANVVCTSVSFTGLWQLACEFMLERSEYPPEAPQDWRQKMLPTCSCLDCKELQGFAADAQAKTYYFRVREDRRRHLEYEIRQSKVDMECHTESTGSPKTLVCTKNRRSYEARCKRYQDDVALIGDLIQVQVEPNGPSTALRERLVAATKRLNV